MLRMFLQVENSAVRQIGKILCVDLGKKIIALWKPSG